MSISDINQHRGLAMRLCRVYLVISAFCALFGLIYEIFSHEVYSYYMIYAFGFPLIGGALPSILLALSKRCPIPSIGTRYLWHSAIAALTVGSVVKGVLDIYGTTSRLVYIYFLAGIIFACVGVLAQIIASASSGERHDEKMTSSDNNT